MSNVLLITATIAPGHLWYNSDQPAVARRMAEYLEAFDFYLGELAAGTFDRILFVENSRHDLSELRDRAVARKVEKDVAFISVEPGPVKHVGLFYLELDLLKQAFDSPEVRALPADVMFWKVTGRYVVTNIGKIVGSMPPADVYANGRDYPRPWTDFYLAAFNRKAFDALLRANEQAYDTLRSGEEIFRESLGSELARGLVVVPRFTVVPRVRGRRGFDGRNHAGIKGAVRYGVRVAANKVVPWLWI